MPHADASGIGLVVFDWAGTTVDFGCFAPVAAFMTAFARHGVTVTAAETRAPMGLHKRDHIRSMIATPRVAEAWLAAHRRPWAESDVESIFQAFIPLQLEVLDRHSTLIDGIAAVAARLREQGVRTAGTTGYFRQAADRVAAQAAKQGYAPDILNCPEDVPQGRPAPHMIFRSMELSGVAEPWRVLKIGDTVADVQEGRNAGVWTYGVVETSSETGCTEEEWQALPREERDRRSQQTARTLLDAGAHGVVASVRDTFAILEAISGRLRHGARP